MSSLPQTRSDRRPPRVRLADITPAVLRMQDGGCTTSELQVVSLTGGLLSLPRPLHQGSRVKMMFLTEIGPVLGSAEMLTPITLTQQPFRFVSLRGDDQHRLQTTISSLLYPKSSEPDWIEKYRTAMSQSKPRRSRLSKMIVGALAAGALLTTALLVFHTHLFK
jgi:hypothetical protein